MGGQLLQNGKQSFVDANGRPLAGGRVFFFSPGTQTFRDTWQDAALTILNTNPIILDARGEASIYGLGAYRQVLRSASGVLIWDQVLPDILSAVDDALDVFFASASKVVDNIAALRALDKTVNKNAFVLGYYGKGDGGGGNYFVDPIDTTSADNGGTVIVAADGARWKLAYINRVSIDQFGAKRNNLGSDAPFNDSAVQKAFDAGVPLSAGKGTYQFSLSRNIVLENGPTVCALLMVSGLNILGSGMGETIFKLRDNESTDANPKSFNFISGNQVYEYVTFDGITFDLNGQNNPISPNRGAGVYNAYNCAAIMIFGSVASGGADARISKSKLLRLEIINTPGVTGIAVGGRFTHPGIKGFDVEIAHCRFYNNGIDSADHSSIYGFCNYLNVHDNVFDHPVPSTGHRGPVCCIELFGSNNSAHNNKFNNYLQFAWVGCGEEGVHSNILIHSNQGSASYRFVDTWSFGPQNNGLHELQIFGNNVNITGAPMGFSGLERVGINLQMNVADLDVVKIFGNSIKCFDRSANTGIVVFPGSGHQISGVSIYGNTLDGFSRAVAGGGPGRLLDVSIDGNQLVNCHTTDARPTDTRGIDFTGINSFCTLAISDNKISGGDLNPNPLFGIAISGEFGSVHVDGNAIRAGTDIAISAIVVGRRTGAQARIYTGPPADAVWQPGDRVTNSSIAILNPSGSQYTIHGWVATAAGSGAGAGWVQERVLTGT